MHQKKSCIRAAHHFFEGIWPFFHKAECGVRLTQLVTSQRDMLVAHEARQTPRCSGGGDRSRECCMRSSTTAQQPETRDAEAPNVDGGGADNTPCRDARVAIAPEVLHNTKTVFWKLPNSCRRQKCNRRTLHPAILLLSLSAAAFAPTAETHNKVGQSNSTPTRPGATSSRRSPPMAYTAPPRTH